MNNLSLKSTSSGFHFFRNVALKPANKEEEPGLVSKVEKEDEERLAHAVKSTEEFNEILLNPDQKTALREILLESHIVESQPLNTRFTLSALELIDRLNKRLIPKEDKGKMQLAYSYGLIGSRVGSLFRPQTCNDTDILIDCKIKIDSSYLKGFSSLRQFFSLNTKFELDQIRDEIELVIKSIYENSTEVPTKHNLSLKQIWDYFFTKRKFENDPINSLKDISSNRYGIIHIGKTLEVKYTVTYEIEDHIISGFLNPCTFVQDDLRVSLDPILTFKSFDVDIKARSIENPIEQVIKSLLANELSTEKPDASKFFSHLTKVTLKEGITKKSHIEKNFSLVLESMDLATFEARLSNALQDKEPFARLMCLINCCNLAHSLDLDKGLQKALLLLLEKLFIESLYDRAIALSSTLAKEIVIQWSSLIILLISNHAKKDFFPLANAQISYQIITPTDPFKLILGILSSGVSKDQLLDLYRIILPSLSFSNPINDSNDLLRVITLKLKEHLTESEMRILGHYLLFNHNDLFLATELETFLKDSKDSYLRFKPSLFVSPFNGQLYSIDGFFETLSITFFKLSLDEFPKTKSPLITSSLSCKDDYGLQSLCLTDEIKKAFIFKASQSAFDPYVDCLVLKLMVNLEEESVKKNQDFILQHSFKTLINIFNIKDMESYRSQIIDLISCLLMKVLPAEEMSDPQSVFDSLDSDIFLSLLSQLITSNSKKLNQVAFYLLDMALNGQFVLNKESIKSSCIQLLIHSKDLPEEYLKLLRTIEPLKIFEDTSIDEVIVFSAKTLFTTATCDLLQKIYQLLQRSDWLKSDEVYKKLFIVNSIIGFLKNIVSTIKTRTDVNKIKEIIFLLKASIQSSNSYFEENVAIVFSQLLNISSSTWPDVYMALFFAAQKSKSFDRPTFCQSVLDTFIIFLSRLDDNSKKLFFKKITALEDLGANLDTLFMPIIEKEALACLEKLDILSIIKVRSEIHASWLKKECASLIASKIQSISSFELNEHLKITLRSTFETSEIKCFLEFSQVAASVEELACELLKKTNLLIKKEISSKESKEQAYAFLSWSLKLYQSVQPFLDKSKVGSIFEIVFKEYLALVVKSDQSTPICKILKRYISIFTDDFNEETNIWILKTLMESSIPAYKLFGYSVFKEIYNKNPSDLKSIIHLYLSLLVTFGKENNFLALSELFLEAMKMDLINDKVPTEQAEINLKLILRSLFRIDSHLLPLETSIEVIKSIFSNKILKRLFFTPSFCQDFYTNLFILKAFITQSSLSTLSKEGFEILKCSMMELQERQITFNKQVSTLDPLSKAAEDVSLKALSNLFSNIIKEFILSKHLNLNSSKWLELLQFIVTTPLDLFNGHKNEKYDHVIIIMLAVIDNLKRLRAIDFSGKKSDENKARFIETLYQIKAAFEYCLDDSYFLSQLITKYCLEIESIITFFVMGSQFDPALENFVLDYLKRIDKIKVPSSPFYQYQLVCINSALKGMQFLLEFNTPINKDLLLQIDGYAKEVFSFLSIDNKVILKLLEEYSKLFLQVSNSLPTDELTSKLFETISSLLFAKPQDLQPIYRYLIERTSLTTPFLDCATRLFKDALANKVIQISTDKPLFLSLKTYLDLAKIKNETLQNESSKGSLFEPKTSKISQDILFSLYANYEELINSVLRFFELQTLQDPIKTLQSKLAKIKLLLTKQQTLEMKQGHFPEAFHEIMQNLIVSVETLKQSLATSPPECFSTSINSFIDAFSFLLAKRTSGLNTFVFYRLFGTNLFLSRKEFPHLCQETIKSYIDVLVGHGLVLEH